MATLTTTRGAATFPVGGAATQGVAQVAVGVYNWATAVSDADIVEMVRIPAGATVYGGYLQTSDLDTDATEALDIDIGWAANGSDAVDTDGFGNLGICSGDTSVHVPVAGNYMPFANIIQHPGFKTFAAETVITMLVNTNAATLTAGTAKVVVNYIVDPNFAA